jgi:DNA polymerase-4
MPQATARTRKVLETARELLAAAQPLIEAQGLTLIGISLTNLEDEDRVQLALPFERLHDAALDLALDQVRDRYGSNAITRAVLVGRDPGFSMPLLPD